MGKFIFVLMFFSVFIFAQEVRLLHTKVSSANWGESIKLEANITNAHLVNYIVVNYKTDLEQHYSQIEMNPAEGKFIAEIPPTNDNYTKISYYIEIFDANEKVTTTFASKKDPQIIKIEKTTDIEGNNTNSITVQTKDKDVKFKTNSSDFEIYMSELESLYSTKVTTASKTAQKASDAPATIYVITEEMIKKRGYTNLEDIFDDIPGIEIQKKSTAEYENYITVRGLAGNDKLIIMMDGYKISPADNTPCTVGTNYPLIAVKQVEIVIGPASALYGPDAVNGIVNIITKTGKEFNGLEITTSYGNDATTLEQFAGGFESNGLSFMATGHYYHSDEPNFANIYSKEYEWFNNEYKELGIVQVSPFAPASVTQEVGYKPYSTPTDSFSFHGKLNYSDAEFGYFISRESHNTSIGGKPEFNLYISNAIYKTTLQTIYGKHTFKSPSEKFLLTSSLSYGSYEIHPDTEFVNQFTAYKDGYKYGFGRTVKFEEQFTLNISSKYVLVGGLTFDINNSLPESSDLPKKYDPDRAADEQKIYYPGTDVKDKDGNDLSIYEDFYYLEYNNIGSYLQFQANPINSIQLTLGSRFDYNTRYGQSFNPRAGLVINPNNSMTFKLLYGQAFLAPSPFYGYQHYGSFNSINNDNGTPEDKTDDYSEGFTANFWRVANPDLKPEKLSNFEGSAIFNISDFMIITLNGFYQKLSDMITTEVLIDSEFNSFQGIPVGAVARRTNEGTLTTYGGSLRLDFLFKAGSFSILPNITYSYTDGKLDNDQEKNPNKEDYDFLIYAAKHTIKGGADVKISDLFFSTRFIYRGASYHKYAYEKSGTDEYNKEDYKSDPFFIINLNARYENLFSVGGLKFSAFMNIYNLLNTKHYNVAVADDEGFIATPQDTFRFLGGLIYKW